jgi:hypothetical protein
MTKRTLITTAAAIFAAGTFVTAAHADGGVKCHGTNACKGQSACKSATNACKGQNACKSQGFTEMKDSTSCTGAGGTVM